MEVILPVMINKVANMTRNYIYIDSEAVDRNLRIFYVSVGDSKAEQQRLARCRRLLLDYPTTLFQLYDASMAEFVRKLRLSLYPQLDGALSGYGRMYYIGIFADLYVRSVSLRTLVQYLTWREKGKCQSLHVVNLSTYIHHFNLYKLWKKSNLPSGSHALP